MTYTSTGTVEDGVYDSRFSQVTSLIFTEKAYTISDAVSLYSAWKRMQTVLYSLYYSACSCACMMYSILTPPPLYFTGRLHPIGRQDDQKK